MTVVGITNCNMAVFETCSVGLNLMPINGILVKKHMAGKGMGAGVFVLSVHVIKLPFENTCVYPYTLSPSRPWSDLQVTPVSRERHTSGQNGDNKECSAQSVCPQPQSSRRGRKNLRHRRWREMLWNAIFWIVCGHHTPEPTAAVVICI